MLIRALQRLPGVAIADEPFHPLYAAERRPGHWPGDTPLRAWLDQQWHAAGGTMLRAVLTHEEQLTAAGDDVCRTLREIVTHAVILHRENLLAQFASRRIAQRTNEWRSDANLPPTSERIRVDPADYQEFRGRMVHSLVISRARWRHVPTLELSAEDLVTGWPASMLELSQLLEIDLTAAVPVTQQRECRPLSEVITNWEKLTR
jgi:hypothetical protein